MSKPHLIDGALEGDQKIQSRLLRSQMSILNGRSARFTMRLMNIPKPRKMVPNRPRKNMTVKSIQMAITPRPVYH